MSVLVFTEYRNENFGRISLEAVAAAKEIASGFSLPLIGVVIGPNASNVARKLPAARWQRVLSVEHPQLETYTAEGFTLALEQIVRALEPKIVVFPHTYMVRDFAPRLAARLDRILVSDVVETKTSGGTLTVVRQLFQGKLNAEVAVKAAELAFVSIQAGAFRGLEQAAEAVDPEPFAVTIEPSQIRSRPEPPFRETQRSVDLGSADRIVAVGRGIQEKENLPMMAELASLLDAEMAASRPICDNGWLPMERQVGSSGQTVAPKAYFAFGISGAIQHLVGMKGAKTVIAVNKDENAPIFEVADYGIVGDLFDVVPALIEELKKVKG